MTPLQSFFGGLQLPANKRQSTGEPIRAAGLPAELIFPLQQSNGTALTPLVVAGQAVLKGEPIAAVDGVPLHAATSGTVLAIEPRPIANADIAVAPCIVLQPDGADRWVEHRGIADYRALERAELLTRIRTAGIIGLGGAGFPTAAKLSAGLATSIDTLIINGVECEPYLSADDMLMRERAADVVGGAEILRHLLQPQRTVIAVEDDKPEAIAALRAVASGDLDVVAVPTRYPAGGEQQLIQVLTGREVPSGGLPMDIGIVCQNVGTAAAVHAAVIRGEPLLSRIVTVTGGACARPGNYEVLFGTPLSHLLAQSGFDATRCAQLLVGGPMMGYPLADTAAPVTGTTNCVLAATAAERPVHEPRACIRCGRCAEACPAALLPQQLYRFARAGDHAQLAAHHLFDCIECGACSYICPSHIPLVDYYRQAKSELLALEQERVAAIRAKARFEAHQQRIARDEAERDARRQARREAQATAPVAPKPTETAAAAPADDRLSVVQAAIARTKAKKAALTGAPAQRPAVATLTDDPAQQLAALRRRLANAEQKLPLLREQGSPKTAELEASVAELRAQIAAAETAAGNPPP